MKSDIFFFRIVKKNFYSFIDWKYKEPVNGIALPNRLAFYLRVC